MKDINDVTLLNSIHIDNVITEHTRTDKKNQLTLTQKKTILLLASLLTKDDLEMSEVTLSIADYFRIMQVDYTGRTKEELRKSILNFTSKCFYLPISGSDCFYHWLDKAEINYDEGTITFKLSNDLKPFFLNMSGKARTIFQLGYALQFSGKYTIDLYMFASRAKNLNAPYNMKLEEVLERFGDHKYNRYTDIMRFVIEPSIREINEKSDLKVYAKPIRKKNKTTHIAFMVFKKTGKQLQEANEWQDRILNVKTVNDKVREAFEDEIFIDAVDRKFVNPDDPDVWDFDSEEYLKKTKTHKTKAEYKKPVKPADDPDIDEDDDYENDNLGNIDIKRKIQIYENMLSEADNEFEVQNINEELKRLRRML